MKMLLDGSYVTLRFVFVFSWRTPPPARPAGPKLTWNCRRKRWRPCWTDSAKYVINFPLSPRNDGRYPLRERAKCCHSSLCSCSIHLRLIVVYAVLPQLTAELVAEKSSDRAFRNGGRGFHSRIDGWGPNFAQDRWRNIPVPADQNGATSCLSPSSLAF